MRYRHVLLFAAVLGGLAVPAWSQSVCSTVNQFNVTVVFTGGDQQTVNWVYDFTNQRQAFQYLANDGSVAQTTLLLYRQQLQYQITPSTGRCQKSPLLSTMPQATVPGSFLSSTDWTIGGTLSVTGYLYNVLFPFGPIGTALPQPHNQQVQLVITKFGCIPVSWHWSLNDIISLQAEFRNYVPAVDSAIFTPPTNCSASNH